jgi:hypothetical protein
MLGGAKDSCAGLAEGVLVGFASPNLSEGEVIVRSAVVFSPRACILSLLGRLGA